MKQYKYKLQDVAAYEYQYIQRHLTEMAAQGWRLDKINSMGVWRYRRAEPADLRYEVTYAPSASAYNSRPTAQEEALTDICAEAGWEKVASLAQMHIYCNENPDATPLETDELSRIRTLRKAMKRSVILPYLLLTGLFLIQLWMQITNLNRWPTNAYTSTLMMSNLTLMPMVIVSYIGMVVGYLIWVRRAMRAAEDGLPVPECRFYRRFRFVLWFVIAAYLALILMESDYMLAGAVLLLTVAIMAGVSVSMEICKSMGAPKWVNIFVPFLVTFLILMVANPVIFGTLDAVSASEEPAVPEDLPLYLTDILESEAEPITITYEESSSLLASKVRLWQEDGDSNHELSYIIIDTDFGFAYDACLNELEQDFMQSASYLSNGIINTCKLNNLDLLVKMPIPPLWTAFVPV